MVLVMSEEQLKAFMEAVKADAGLQEGLKAAGDSEAVVAIAKEAGFMISSDELQRADFCGFVDELYDAELSQEELEGVVGGGGGIDGVWLPKRQHPDSCGGQNMMATSLLRSCN